MNLVLICVLVVPIENEGPEFNLESVSKVDDGSVNGGMEINQVGGSPMRNRDLEIQHHHLWFHPHPSQWVQEL